MTRTILTVTLNPSLDLSTRTASVEPGLKLRCDPPTRDPGGGGINVARAITQLGGQATALVAMGGATGAQLMHLLAERGVPTIAFQGPGDTRQSMSVMEAGTGQQYRFVLPGPEWSDADVTRALAAIDNATGARSFVVLSGSQPPGVARTFPSLLAAHVADREAALIVDTSGAALRDVIAGAHPAIDTLRMDDAEAEDLAGHALPTRADSARFAASLVARGAARHVIVARGADGSVMATPAGAWHAVAPPVQVVSAVGAGDSFVGAYTMALAAGTDRAEALRFATAAASAACMTPATALCTAADVAREVTGTTLTQL